MDFWTYVGQIVNFIVFLVILYLLLYKPMRRIMKQRKDEMEAELRKAETLRAEAEKVREEAEANARKLEEKRDAILKEARDQAETHRKESLKATEEQARGRLERFRRIMEQERNDLLGNITDSLRDTVAHAAGAVLNDSAVDLSTRGIERIEGLLKDLSDQDVQSARKTLENSENRVQVRSASALEDEHCDRLKKAVTNRLGCGEIQLDIEEDPSLLAGIDVTLGHLNLTAHWRAVIDDALQEQDKE